MIIKDKKVIITGAANGIGKQITIQLLEKGASVCALDINKDSLKKLKEELKSDKLMTYVVDVSNQESINSFKEKYMKDCKNVDILINNAGIIQPFKGVEELDDNIIHRVMNVNFFGPLNLTRAFLKEIKESKEGYIVNLSSMGGFFPFPNQSIYGSSKAAIKIFTEGLYEELSKTNVHVMVVFPGAVATDIIKNSNVSTNFSTKDAGSSYKMTSPEDAASQIVNGIEKNKFKLFVGSDAKFMRFLYRLNSKYAIDKINKKMGGLN